jgi:predicted nucleic acid-binding protein
VVIVDTTVWIDYFGGVKNAESDWLDREIPQQRLGLTDVILREVLQGIREEESCARVLREMRRFEVFETGGAELAIAAARNFRRLRQRGYTVRKTIDCWIATFCIRDGHALLHRDRDFEPFEAVLGLRVVRG